MHPTEQIQAPAIDPVTHQPEMVTIEFHFGNEPCPRKSLSTKAEREKVRKAS